MSFVIGLLTVLLTLNSTALILLVLLQLPKKSADAETAFGSGSTDGLIGVSSASLLAKLTGYVAMTFIMLAIVTAYLQSGAWI